MPHKAKAAFHFGNAADKARCSHYRSHDYVNLLNELGMTQSMSRRGNCWDNAKEETFFCHFKCNTIKLMKKQLNDIHDVKRIVLNCKNKLKIIWITISICVRKENLVDCPLHHIHVQHWGYKKFNRFNRPQ